MGKNIITNCDICGNGCGLIISLKDNKAVSVKGNPKDPVSKGKLCIKGRSCLEVLYNKKRVKKPLKKIKENGMNTWKEITWEEALDEIAYNIKKNKECYGPESIFFAYGYSKDFVHTKLIKLAAAIGTPNIVSPDYVCYSPLMWGFKYTMGFFPEAQINSNTKCTIIWGINKYNTRFFDVIEMNKAKKTGMKTIVVDPFRTQHAKDSEIWLSIIPGTDIYLLYGMIYIIIKEKLYDKKMVEKNVIGFDEIKNLVKDYNPEYVSKLTGLKACEIIKTTKMFMSNSPNNIIAGNAFDMNFDSFQKTRMLAILVALSGSVNVDGGMVNSEYSSLTCGRWPYGDVMFDILPKSLRDRSVDKDKKKLPEVYNVAPQSIVNAILEKKPYKVNMGFIQQSNIVTSWPDSNRTISALKKLEFLVVSDLFITPTAELADIILPASYFLEFDGVKESRDSAIHLQRKIDKTGDTLPDFEIINRIGQKLNLGDEFFQSNEDYFSSCIKPSGYTFNELKKNGSIFHSKIKDVNNQENLHLELVENKVHVKYYFYSEELEKHGFDSIPRIKYVPKDMKVSKEFPLYMTTAKSKLFMHSQGRNQESLLKVHPNTVVLVSKKYGEKNNIKSGDNVEIRTRNGNITQKVKLTDDINEKVILVESGVWKYNENTKCDGGELKENYNVLTTCYYGENREIGSVNIRGLACNIVRVDK